jgi:hypothetical protein
MHIIPTLFGENKVESTGIRDKCLYYRTDSEKMDSVVKTYITLIKMAIMTN